MTQIHDILSEIQEKLIKFDLSNSEGILHRADMIILIPPREYNTLLMGYADVMDITEANIMLYGIRCKRTFENDKIIVGVEC